MGRLALVLVLLAAPAGRADWPLARGDVHGSGVAEGKLTDALETLWKHVPEGEPSSFQATAVIHSGVVYVGDADGGFHAVKLADGAPVWRQSFEDSGFISAAAVDARHVFVGDINGEVRCLSVKDGAEAWSFDAESEVYAGPTLHEGALLVTTEGGVFVSLDAATGAERWRFTIEAPLRCSPTLVAGRVLLAGCDAKLHAIDASTGKEVATAEVGDATGNTAAALGDRCFFGTEGGALMAVDATGPMRVAWTFRDKRRGQGIRSSAAVTPRAVVFGAQSKAVFAVNPQTGEPLWTAPQRSRVESSPVVVGQRVFIATAAGRAALLDLATGRDVWEYDAGGGFVASPAVSQGRVVLGNDDGTLYCFGAKAD